MGRLEDTICAIATPVGVGGIGIVRISGEKALAVAASCARLRRTRDWDALTSHHLYQADIVDPGSPAGGGGCLLDQALVTIMRRPHSYTGENVVEFHCHGGALLLQELCALLVRQGARLAEPGEFTKRAFLNGRLDLAQAEAVLDTIHAQTTVGLRLAQEQLRGTLSRVLAEERDRLIQLLAKVEASIDFTEEDISFVSAAELAASIRTTSEAVARLIASAQAGRIFREGVGAAIVGRPNVGKSSLLNALLESDRAIVTPIPGTTRDVLEEVLNVRGIAVRVLDTAGLRTTHDPVEEEGVRRSQRAIEEADVLLIVLDGSCPLGEEDQAVLACAPGKRRVIVVNKSDLPWAWQLEDGLPTDQSRGTDVRVIRVSAKLGQGLDGLKDQLRDLVLRADVEPPATAMVTTLRHQLALERTQDALAQALASANAGMSGEFVAMDLRAATDALGEIVGAVCTDDILDRIFKDFCIGK